MRTTQQVKEYFESHGCKLLSEYEHCMIKLDYVCKCGRNGSTSWNNFTKGKRCGHCHPTGRKKKYTIEEMKQFYRSHGCELLEDEYTSNKAKMRFRCRCGKEHVKQFNEFKKFPQCYDCYIKSRSGEKHHGWIEDREQKRLNDLFRKKCYKALRTCLEKTGQLKWSKTADILGYGPTELQEHIRNHPNWNKVKDGDWHLDHIFPINAFLEHGIMDLRIINHLDNLQPLRGSDNIRKNSKYRKKDFLTWLSLINKSI